MTFKPAYLVVLGLLAIVGCGGGGETKSLDMGGEDGNKISMLIEEMNDAVGNKKKLAELFVSGAKLPEPKASMGMSFFIVGKPSVQGTSATAKVRIDKNSQAAGEKQWTFEKVGDAWKIKDAPVS